MKLLYTCDMFVVTNFSFYFEQTKKKATPFLFEISEQKKKIIKPTQKSKNLKISKSNQKFAYS